MRLQFILNQLPTCFTVLMRWRILQACSFQSANGIRPLLSSLLPASISGAAVDTVFPEGPRCYNCKVGDLRYRKWDCFDVLIRFSDGQLVFLSVILAGAAASAYAAVVSVSVYQMLLAGDLLQPRQG